MFTQFRHSWCNVDVFLNVKYLPYFSQIYKNNSYPSQHEEGKNNTKGHKRTSRPVEHSVQHAYITTRSSHLHHALANQQNTLPLSATSFCKGPVKALFPAHRKEMITSCTTGSLVSPPSPCHTVLADSALYQDRALATPSPCCTVLAGSALYQYQALAKSSLHQCVPVPPMPQPSTSGVGGGGGGKVDPYGLPTPEQLCQVHDILIESVTVFLLIFKDSLFSIMMVLIYYHILWVATLLLWRSLSANRFGVLVSGLFQWHWCNEH